MVTAGPTAALKDAARACSSKRTLLLEFARLWLCSFQIVRTIRFAVSSLHVLLSFFVLISRGGASGGIARVRGARDGKSNSRKCAPLAFVFSSLRNFCLFCLSIRKMAPPSWTERGAPGALRPSAPLATPLSGAVVSRSARTPRDASAELWLGSCPVVHKDTLAYH